jgi:hypothetical protein
MKIPSYEESIYSCRVLDPGQRSRVSDPEGGRRPCLRGHGMGRFLGVLRRARLPQRGLCLRVLRGGLLSWHGLPMRVLRGGLLALHRLPLRVLRGGLLALHRLRLRVLRGGLLPLHRLCLRRLLWVLHGRGAHWHHRHLQGERRRGSRDLAR